MRRGADPARKPERDETVVVHLRIGLSLLLAAKHDTGCDMICSHPRNDERGSETVCDELIQ